MLIALFFSIRYVYIRIKPYYREQDPNQLYALQGALRYSDKKAAF